MVAEGGKKKEGGDKRGKTWNNPRKEKPWSTTGKEKWNNARRERKDKKQAVNRAICTAFGQTFFNHVGSRRLPFREHITHIMRSAEQEHTQTLLSRNWPAPMRNSTFQSYRRLSILNIILSTRSFKRHYLACSTEPLRDQEYFWSLNWTYLTKTWFLSLQTRVRLGKTHVNTEYENPSAKMENSSNTESLLPFSKI